MMRRSLLLSCALLATFVAAGCGYFTSPEKRVERAEKLFAEGEARNALIELRNALKDKPDQPKARLLLAEVALWLGDQGAAERELREVPENFEKARRDELAQRIDLAAGRYAEVLANIGPLTDEQPAALWFNRGIANQGLGRIAEAESDFKAALENDARLIAAEAALVETRAAQGDLTDALTRARALAREHPDSALAWFVRGSLLAQAASMREAQDALERSANLAPRQLDVFKQVSLLITLTEVQIANHELEKASASAATLARVVPGSPIAAVNSARVMMASSDFAGAAVELRRVVNRAPQLTRARFLLGMALAAEGNLSQANQELTELIEQAPQNMEARQLLAQVRMRLEDPDSALRVLVPALDQLGGDRTVNQLFDAAREQLGDSSRSLTLIEREYQKSPDNKGLRLQLAAAYLRAQQGAKALALLRADNGPPDPVSDRLLLAATAQAEGPEAAKRKLDQMLVARPNDVQLALTAAQIYVTAGDMTQARRLLADALGRNPEHRGLRLALARTQLASGARADGVENLTQLRQSDPHAVEARLLLAQLALQRDDAKEAGTLIDEAVSGSQQVADTQNAAGLIYLATARYDAAIAHFRAGTEADPAIPTLWLNLGRSQLALEQYEAARQSLQRALTLQANWLPAEGALTYLDLQTGNPEAALKRVDALRAAQPKDSGVYMLEAEVRGALHQYPEADRALAQAASLQPSGDIADKNYQVRLAGKLPKPTEPLENWIADHPQDLRARNTLAQAYMRAGQRQGAAQQYEAIVARQPRDPIALNNLAWLYFELGDRRAVETARKASALAPDAPAITDTLGWVLVQTGAVNEGLGLLKKGLERDPRNGDMQYHYAAALAKSGKTADAQARLRTLMAGKEEFASRSEAQELLERLNKAHP